MSENFVNIKTLDEVLQHNAIKNITKFVSKKEIYKYDKLGYIPCYHVGKNKGYKIKEVAKWISEQLITSHKGSNILTNFNVTVNNAKKATVIPEELTNHNGDIYEYDAIPSCVYFLIDSGQIVYVGQSINLGQRIAQHNCSNKEFNRVIYMIIENERLDEIERFFIETLNPKYNIDNIKTYRYKGLGYKIINKILYKENSKGLLDKIL